MQARAERERDTAKLQAMRAAINEMSGCECKRDSAQPSMKGKTMKSPKFQFIGRLAVVLGLLAAAGSAPAQDILYKQPPKPVLEALRALPSPGISVSQQRDKPSSTQPSGTPLSA